MFTPLPTTLGALLLHLSTTHLLTTTSQILGVSSLLRLSVLSPDSTNTPITLGLLAAAALTRLLWPSLLPHYGENTVAYTAAAGALVGFGTRLARGCTSGHMLCGVPRGALRSLVATGVFFTTAVITTAVLGSAPECAGGACYTATWPAYGDAVAMAAVVGAAVIGGAVLRGVEGVPGTVQRFWAGLVFGAGLLVSGMAAPGKTLGFLAIGSGRLELWDPSLAIVAVVGVGGNALVWWRQGLGERVKAVAEGVEWRLLLGSVVFGVGWGMAGICPGPGVLGAVLDGWRGAAWVAAFLGGSVAGGFI
ncbi:hypothetical protein EDC01DRAFT_610399 [Geopyxis carbonaria]|nr:hypothetical protein EDC01DRAFT_610399 [Geopyxis carbonaria]